jgi:hypothetical protein
MLLNQLTGLGIQLYMNKYMNRSHYYCTIIPNTYEGPCGQQ